MLEAAKYVLYPYLHRDLIATAQNCEECRRKGKNFKVISGKQHFTALDAVLEPNGKIQLEFAGPLPDKNKKEVYILVVVDRFSRFPSAKVVKNNKADTKIRFMPTQTSAMTKHKGLGRKIYDIFQKQSIKLIFAPVDNHRSMGMVEKLIRTLKTRPFVMRIDDCNNPYKLASDVVELNKTLRITLNATTKLTPLEAQFGRKPNTPLSNIATMPKSSNLSWENIKIACLDQRLLTKPALSAEAMWDRERNSQEELDVTNKQQQLPEPTFNPPTNTSHTDATRIQQGCITGKNKKSNSMPPQQPAGAGKWDSSDEEFDHHLMEKFPIGADLPLSNKQYDMIFVTRTFLKENTKNDL